MGPGKAEMLRRIAETGSISAAARSIGMSYRRAWLLVDTMNRCFRAPLVEARPGRGSGGAKVTVEGQHILAAYESLIEAIEAGSRQPALDDLLAAVRDRPAAKSRG